MYTDGTPTIREMMQKNKSPEAIFTLHSEVLKTKMKDIEYGIERLNEQVETIKIVVFVDIIIFLFAIISKI